MTHARLPAKRRRLLAALQAQSQVRSREASPVITDIAAYAVREPASKREYVLARVSTDTGVSGIGEAAANGDAAGVVAALVAQKEALAGRSATAFETIRPAAGQIPPAFAAAHAAVNMALLDITGKLARAPVYQVLGGPTRFKARAATSLDENDLAGSLGRARAAGFRAVLVPLASPEHRNQGQAFVRGTRRLLDKLRQSAGDGIDFVLDCHGALTPGDAQMLAHELESFHLLWLDEPCSPLNLNAAAKISAESVTPIGFGRRMLDNGQFQDLLRMDAVDVLRPDIGLHGITQIRKAAALAETYYVAVAPFHRGGPVATAACLHLAASLPNFFLQEVPLPAAEADRRMRAELISVPVESVHDGYFPLPPGPGLGISLNRDAAARYRAL
jgi:galactonate dehydratase